MRTAIALIVSLIACGCGGDDPTYSCEDYNVPAREAPSDCATPTVPDELAECALGSGYAGRWVVDGRGLPAFELGIDSRCDSIAESDGSRGGMVHLVGNGRGSIGIAHASGAVELYTQDRGHKFLNYIDGEGDAAQIGGGWSYIVESGKVRSTRFDDLSTDNALKIQTRRFGVGYFETQTRAGSVLVTRRVFAPARDERVLIVEVDVQNLTDGNVSVGLVEYWDLNMHQLTYELESSSANNIEEMERRRRELASEFAHELTYTPAARTAWVNAAPLSPSSDSFREPSMVDNFVDPVFLAVIDNGRAPDGVWLTDEEVWAKGGRIPKAVADKGASADERTVEVVGGGGALAIRVPVELAPAAKVTRRFAFGIANGDLRQEPATIAGALRARGSELAPMALDGWKQRLVWAAFPGMDGAGAVQRELAWSSYYVTASAAYDRERDLRVAGPGGVGRYVYGYEGAIPELADIADALILVDPALALDTLKYAMASQMTQDSETPGRIAYGETGIDTSVDVGGRAVRSDAYVSIPAALGRYLSFTLHGEALEQEVPFAPAASKDTAPVHEHLSRMHQYLEGNLGLGSGGMTAMGTGDRDDGILGIAGGLATPGGSSSTTNAATAAFGFPVLAEALADIDSGLAAQFSAYGESQRTAIGGAGWSGEYVYRGLTDDGGALADNLLFLMPQVAAVAAGALSVEDSSALLVKIEAELSTAFGWLDNEVRGGQSVPADIELEVGVVTPSLLGWVIEAAAAEKPEVAWDWFYRSTLSAHAEAFPGKWQGTWTAPARWIGSGDGAGSPAQGVSSGYGALGALHIGGHAGPLRALTALAGIAATGRGARIAAVVPTETYHVRWPTFEVEVTPRSMAGVVTPLGVGEFTLELMLPSELRGQALSVKVNGVGVGDFVRNGDEITLTLPSSPQIPVTWSVSGG